MSKFLVLYISIFWQHLESLKHNLVLMTHQTQQNVTWRHLDTVGLR
jgi:hypothetical protein